MGYGTEYNTQNHHFKLSNRLTTYRGNHIFGDNNDKAMEAFADTTEPQCFVTPRASNVLSHLFPVKIYKTFGASVITIVQWPSCFVPLATVLQRILVLLCIKYFLVHPLIFKLPNFSCVGRKFPVEKQVFNISRQIPYKFNVWEKWTSKFPVFSCAMATLLLIQAYSYIHGRKDS